MSARIDAAFARAQAEGRAALVGYLTAYDPDRERSRDAILTACEAGLDVLELGVPFSDPSADGPAVQAAMVRARAAGADVSGVLALASELRARWPGPIVLFSYANPLLVRGAERVAAEAAQAGIDGALVVDLPPEHADDLAPSLDAVGVAWVPLVAPTTPEARIGEVVARATGFVYAVTMRGVTGASVDLDDASLAPRLAAIARHTDRPVAAGFGVRTPAHVAALARRTQGVVVGSALVEAAHKGRAELATLVRALRVATERRA